MEFVYSLFFVLFTYFFTGTTLFILTLRFYAEASFRKYYRIWYILFLGTGPIVVAWLLENTMYFFPGHTKRFYASLIVLYFVLPWLYLYIHRTETVVKRTVKHYIETLHAYNVYDIFVALAIASIFSPIVILPVVGNDPCQYFYVAQHIFDARDFHMYPLIDQNTNSGYLPWTHPAGYVSLLVWGLFFSHGTEYMYLSKSVNPFYLFMTYYLLYELLKNHYGRFYGSLSALLLFSAPLYPMLAAQFHIDIFRIFFFFAPFVFLSALWETRQDKVFYLVTAALACGAYAHSIGLLAIFFTGLLLLVCCKKTLQIKNIVISSIALGAVLGPRYYQNYLHFGYIIGDKSIVWSLDTIHHSAFTAFSRHLDGTYNLVLNGFLKGFTDFESFGFSFFYPVCVLLLIVLRDGFRKQKLSHTLTSLFKDNPLFRICVIVLGIWYASTLFSTLLGKYSFIKNSRYLLTIYPFVVYISAVLTLELFAHRKRKTPQ